MRTIDYLRGRRAWFVPNFSVWGLAQEAEMLFLAAEDIDGAARVSFGTSAPGGVMQDVLFGELIDFRGNELPAEISSPRVMVRAQTPAGAFIMNQESNTGFRIVRDPEAAGPVPVDLLIFEMG